MHTSLKNICTMKRLLRQLQLIFALQYSDIALIGVYYLKLICLALLLEFSCKENLSLRLSRLSQ